MGFFKRLFGTPETQSPRETYSSHSTDPQQDRSILDEAETFVLKLWKEQHSLVRQAIFWNERNEASMVAFTSAASRDAILEELKASAKNRRAQRLFFYESSATAPDGQQLDVIVVEVGDAKRAFYGQRIYSTDDEPRQLAEDVTQLSKNPLNGMLDSELA
jgi:hypothetical protein